MRKVWNSFTMSVHEKIIYGGNKGNGTHVSHKLIKTVSLITGT